MESSQPSPAERSGLLIANLTVVLTEQNIRDLVNGQTLKAMSVGGVNIDIRLEKSIADQAALSRVLTRSLIPERTTPTGEE